MQEQVSIANIDLFDVENQREAQEGQKAHQEIKDVNPVMEIRKFIELLGEGIITQEKFDKKKSQLL
ncbi:hypothetical protein [Cytobacillus purgationiresistens]|uniref:SHOCT domain-containing protein n=1 Tax=Cytobacillus purgationiresistens TaxID=863449 RepID=A0ABU0AQI4_9BACI|nr:hypothetical protein [Cytobacillus purgationiresistens]MDQ0273567.1 hypothetical protein [Cytobacillus purgationiresistens]